MRLRSDKLKLGKGSVFVKRQLRALPLADADYEADFFRDPLRSTERQEHWTGMVIERGCGSLLAMEDVRMPPPTVNDLATLLSCAMCKSPAYEQRQRPRRIYRPSTGCCVANRPSRCVMAQ